MSHPTDTFFFQIVSRLSTYSSNHFYQIVSLAVVTTGDKEERSEGAGCRAPGKMYQRDTLGILPSASELAAGKKRQQIIQGTCSFGQVRKLKKEIVKKESREVRNKMIVVRLNQQEYDSLEKLARQSICRGRSEYLRKVALQKPVTIRYRNQTADDFLPEMLQLKRELNAIGNNFNQAVHKLHTLDRIPEFRSWLHHYEQARQAVEEKTTQILQRMNQLYEWLQK